jgi:hypothetical protein
MSDVSDDSRAAPWPWASAKLTPGVGMEGYPGIASTDLRPEHVPTPGSPFWPQIAEFALTFDGYTYRGSFEALANWADKRVSAFAASGSLPAGLSIDDLRALLFFEQRRWRHLDVALDEQAAMYVDALLTTIRFRTELTVSGTP